MKLEFFFDCSSPWTYLAFHGIQPIAERHGVAIDVAADPGRRRVQRGQPGGLRRAREPEPAPLALHDEGPRGLGALLRAARSAGRTVFPVNSVKAMRGALVALDEGRLVPCARAVFEAYWGDLATSRSDEVLADDRGRARSRPGRASSPRIEQPRSRSGCAPTPTN